jgi:acyl-CoA thioester hydrolase
MCDAMGHMNVRHYAAMLDDASFQLLGHIAGDAAAETEGWADVRCVIEYKHETRAGALLTVRSHVLRIGRSSLTYRHVMSGSLDEVVRAEAEVTTVRFDLAGRQSLLLAAALRGRAESLIAG